MSIIINDTPFRNFAFNGVTVLDPDMLTEAIRGWSGWASLPKQTTRLVFPGNGANDVRRRLGESWAANWQVDTIAATRFWWPGVSPGAVVGHLMPIGVFDFETTDVVIVDDVISSGTTMRRICDRNYVWMPKANRWHALAWVKQRSANLRGFVSCHSGFEVGDINRKVPINSLSTLLENGKVAASYAKRNFPNPEAFLAALSALQ